MPLRIVNSDGSGEKGTAYLLPMVTLQELADRLERVETEVALHRLAADYCIGADQVDLARFTTIWTSDALWNAAGDDSDDDEYRFRGTDAITTALKGQWATLPRMPHATANHVVERDPENPGAASGRDVAVTVQLPDGRWVLGAGWCLRGQVRARRRGVAHRGTDRAPLLRPPIPASHGIARVEVPE